MQRIDSISALRAKVKSWRSNGQTVAFVPTMGNLHAGHMALVKRAKEIADQVIVSVFVNPLQFDDKADLTAYPRTIDADIQQLTSVDCDIVFTPSVEVMYPNGMDSHTHVVVPNMDDKLCGLSRLGHFDGVATVVCKLFNMVQADFAVFGEKDYQQLLLVRTMVKELNIPVDIVASTTVRERNGLAMSSRNRHLTDEQYDLAAELYQTLLSITTQLQQSQVSFTELEQQAIYRLNSLGFETEYVEIRRATDLAKAQKADKQLRVLVAAGLGKTRLIDNIACNLA
jgi:pantoate--beta-alanine ligase